MFFLSGRDQLNAISSTITLLTLVILALSSNVAELGASPSQSKANAARVSGRVVEAASGRPVSSAQVTFFGNASQSLQTDVSGRFSLDLPAGGYEVRIKAAGYLDGAHGQLWPSGPSRVYKVIEHSRNDISLLVWKFATVTGVVTTSDGSPVPDVLVDLLSAGATEQLKQLKSVRTTNTGSFHFSGVIPGRYFVGAIRTYGTRCDGASSPLISTKCTPYPTRGGPPPKLSDEGKFILNETTFFPGVPTLQEARALTVRSGDSIGEVNFILDRVSTQRLSGTVQSNQSLGNSSAWLTRVGNEAADLFRDLRTAVTTLHEDGGFVFPAVPPGEYEIRIVRYATTGVTIPAHPVITPDGRSVIGGVVAGIKAPTEQEPLFEGVQRLVVSDRDITNIAIDLQRATSVSGSVVFSGGSNPPNQQVVRGTITFQPVAGSALLPSVVTLDATGVFYVPSLLSGGYEFSVRGLPGWFVESIEVSGLKTQGQHLEVSCCNSLHALVVLSKSITALKGIVQDVDGSAGELFALVFPKDSDRWNQSYRPPDQFSFTRVTNGGAFTVSPLRRGEYCAVAVSEGTLSLNWHDAEMLQQLSARCTPFEVNTTDVNITLRPVKLN